MPTLTSHTSSTTMMAGPPAANAEPTKTYTDTKVAVPWFHSLSAAVSSPNVQVLYHALSVEDKRIVAASLLKVTNDLSLADNKLLMETPLPAPANVTPAPEVRSRTSRDSPNA